MLARNENGQWVLSAFDATRPSKNKKKGAAAVQTPGQPVNTEGAGAVAPNLSAGKGREFGGEKQEAGRKSSEASAKDPQAQNDISAEFQEEISELRYDKAKIEKLKTKAEGDLQKARSVAEKAWKKVCQLLSLPKDAALDDIREAYSAVANEDVKEQLEKLDRQYTDAHARIKQYEKEIEGSEEHQRMVEAAEKVRKLKAVSLDEVPSNRDKKACESIVENLENGENKHDGRKVRFVKKSVGKLLGHKGFDYSILIPKLKELYDGSFPAFFEKEEVKSGHKDHTSNFVGYHHYVNKVSLGGKEYYVRFTIQELKTKKKDFVPNEMHNAHATEVSDIEIFNTDGSVPSGIIDPTTGANIGAKPDAKLRNFFLMASGDVKEFAKRLKYATGWERGADGKWRDEEPDGKVSERAEAAEGLLKRLGGDGTVCRSVEDLRETEAWQLADEETRGRMERSYGFFDRTSGRIVINAEESSTLGSVAT